GQAVDPLGEKRDLHLGRPRVSIVDAILLNEGLLLFDGQRHGASNRHVPGCPRLHLNGFKTPCFAAIYGAMVPSASRSVYIISDKLRRCRPPRDGPHRTRPYRRIRRWRSTVDGRDECSPWETPGSALDRLLTRPCP